MNKFYQPHEAHIPYLLQLFIDYNLYGMNLINLAAVKFRKAKKKGVFKVRFVKNILDITFIGFTWYKLLRPSAFVIIDVYSVVFTVNAIWCETKHSVLGEGVASQNWKWVCTTWILFVLFFQGMKDINLDLT